MSAFLPPEVVPGTPRAPSEEREPTDAVDASTRRVLELAVAHCTRRGSCVLREVDMAYAVKVAREAMGMPAQERAAKKRPPRWYLIPVAGDGGCLFTSMRLLLELHYLVRKIRAGDVPDRYMLNGKHPQMIAAGRTLRASVVEWYRRYLAREVPQLGQYSAGGRLWQRGDLLALEAIRRGVDMPESGPARTVAMTEYLTVMAHHATWGGTPEYTAVACMTQKTVRVWQLQGSGLYNINRVPEPAPAPAPASPGTAAASPAAALPPLLLGCGAGAGACGGAGAGGGACGGAGACGAGAGACGAPPPHHAPSPLASPASAHMDAEVYEDTSSSDEEEEGEKADEDDGTDAAAIADEEPLCLDLFYQHNHYQAMVPAHIRDLLIEAYGAAVAAHFVPLA